MIWKTLCSDWGDLYPTHKTISSRGVRPRQKYLNSCRTNFSQKDISKYTLRDSVSGPNTFWLFAVPSRHAFGTFIW
ncbi:hypothetical protein I7I53_03441 [Histoplasma capsulatum var. duboisii H88]|uniref:Uncharacterized protein n=1 Tax=Ajellomyces capsulatus (strain H88) TaxID=544711 RepID=A0A8A1LNJ1_AJEC8|nr:hypothetical protein I7I53_03441 [Histoplasma capsulatum var. duboisii H88]